MRRHGFAVILWATVFLTPMAAQNPGTSCEQQIRELEALRATHLISKEACEQRLREILDQKVSEDFDFDLSGVWQVRVEKLSIWAPRYTLNKTIGMTRWKLSVTDGALSLRESSPDPSPAAEPGETAFEEVEVRKAVIAKDLIAFQVESASGAYEHYRLEHFSNNEIVGTYVVRDRVGGGPDNTSEYRGRLVLEKVGQRLQPLPRD